MPGRAEPPGIRSGFAGLRLLHRKERKAVAKEQHMQRMIQRRCPNAIALAAFMVGAAICTSLTGCSSLYSEGATAGAGIAGAAIASQVTNNAAVASGIGLGALAAARAGVQYSERVMHSYSQGQIAQAAGPLAVGAVAPWFTRHTVPIEPDEKGRVTVSRVISTGTLDCKEIVFSVDTDARKDEPASSAFYVASVCRDGNQWKWASAEPATPRWGALQ
jgi:hypothetical protein